MIRINVTKAGRAFADAEVEDEALKLKDGDQVDTSTELFLTVVRVLVKEKIITCPVKVYFNDTYVSDVDPRGRLAHWPDDLCVWDTLLDRLLAERIASF